MSESAALLLASCLNGSREWLNAAAEYGIRADDFALPTHQEIWRAIERLQLQGRGVRLGSVVTELRKNPEASTDAHALAAHGQSIQNPGVHLELIKVERMTPAPFCVMCSLARQPQ